MTSLLKNYDIPIENTKLKLLTLVLDLFIILCLYHDSQDVIIQYRKKMINICKNRIMTLIFRNYDIYSQKL